MTLLARLRRTLLRLTLTLLFATLLRGLWFSHYRVSADRATRGQDLPDLVARRAYLVERTTADDFGPRDFPEVLGDPFRGEWALVSLSMTGLALAGMAQRFPDQAGTTESDLQKLIDRALTGDLSSFDTVQWKEVALDTLPSDRGHAGYLGHLALLVAADELAFPGGPNRPLLGRLAEALARKVEQSPCGLAETYPGEIYVPDNAVIVAALALSARAGLLPAARPREILDKIHARYADRSSGLLPFRVGPGCAAAPEARASGASWSLLYLALADEAYAARGYESLRTRFLDQPLPGVTGLREWPRGVDRPGDVDSGPLLLGLSPAATGFTVALARRFADADTLQGLLDTAELAGFTADLRGRRRYLLAPLVGDAILLAARSPLLPPAR